MGSLGHGTLTEEQIEQILTEMPAFSTLDQEKIKEIARAGETVSFGLEEFVLREGEVATCFFLILEGQVEVQQRSVPLGRLGRGQFFGESAIVQTETRSADIVAIQPTTCLKLSAARLKELVNADPQIAVKLLEEVIRRNRPIFKGKSGEDAQKSPFEPKFDFESELGGKTFESLVDAFVHDYMIKRIVGEKCGWRSITDIAQQTGASVRVYYGKRGGFGSALAESIRRGLIETRYFPGERGRGGEIVRFRVAYEKEPVREYVNRRIRVGKKSSVSIP